METRKADNVLREIRRVRNKHYEETKNMSREEVKAYYRRNSERFREELSKMNFKGENPELSFSYPRKEATNDR
ncbi:MAG: hypothetical protein LBU34_00585 [Planctomycetaceae bacterium]|jgi:hypothetical protein|nr:hypothetical protein [Planctomycetaceae bacterium]